MYILCVHGIGTCNTERLLSSDKVILAALDTSWFVMIQIQEDWHHRSYNGCTQHGQEKVLLILISPCLVGLIEFLAILGLL